jgi:hypothetical protein
MAHACHHGEAQILGPGGAAARSVSCLTPCNSHSCPAICRHEQQALPKGVTTDKLHLGSNTLLVPLVDYNVGLAGPRKRAVCCLDLTYACCMPTPCWLHVVCCVRMHGWCRIMRVCTVSGCLHARISTDTACCCCVGLTAGCAGTPPHARVCVPLRPAQCL